MSDVSPYYHELAKKMNYYCLLDIQLADIISYFLVTVTETVTDKHTVTEFLE